jgi:hypothetical protein
MGQEAAQRDELIRAREVIRAQLEELQLRTAPYGHGNALPPDFRSIIAELESEVGEIEEILRSDEEDQAE